RVRGVGAAAGPPGPGAAGGALGPRLALGARLALRPCAARRPRRSLRSLRPLWSLWSLRPLRPLWSLRSLRPRRPWRTAAAERHAGVAPSGSRKVSVGIVVILGRQERLDQQRIAAGRNGLRQRCDDLGRRVAGRGAREATPGSLRR